MPSGPQVRASVPGGYSDVGIWLETGHSLDMFLFVSPRAKAIAAAVAIGGWALVAPACASNSSPTASTKGPTRAQIRAAIHRALHSRVLWATVNICDTMHHQNVIGIRGQMPSLSFAAGLRM